MNIDPHLLGQAKALLEASWRPLLISHPRPDGDTIGCALALSYALRERGKAPTLACVHPAPETMHYLPGADAFVQEVPENADIDLVVAIDMSDLQRTGGLYKEAWRHTLPLLVIDHHETNDGFGDVSVAMPEAAATALPMIPIIESLGVEIKDDLATALLLGILTDTRGLRTEATTPDVLATVARLIDAGGDYLSIVQKTLDAVPYQQMRGWGVALSRLQLEDSIAWTTFPLAEKQALGIEDHDDLDLGNLVSQVAEAEIIATFLEMYDGTVKVSLRARPSHNVAGIAKALGGGGHRLAAGCSVTGPLDAATAKVLPLVRQELHAAP
jgi:bifunctional oligoribonuclease and PAP phosphatase NrnA